MRLAVGRGELRLPGGTRQPAAHRADHLATEALPLRLGTGVQQRRAPREVVEHQERARREVMRVRTIVDGRRARRQALQITDEVVARYTHEPAVQREAVAARFRAGRLRERGSQRAEQSGLVGRPRLHLGPDAQSVGIETELEAVTETDEGVTRQPFAALNAFQQKARPEGLQLEKGRDRGVEVSCDVEDGSCGHTPVLCREDRGRRNEKPIPGGSRRWVLEVSRTKLRAGRPLLFRGGATTRGRRSPDTATCSLRAAVSTNDAAIAKLARERRIADKLVSTPVAAGKWFRFNGFIATVAHRTRC